MYEFLFHNVNLIYTGYLKKPYLFRQFHNFLFSVFSVTQYFRHSETSSALRDEAFYQRLAEISVHFCISTPKKFRRKSIFGRNAAKNSANRNYLYSVLQGLTKKLVTSVKNWAHCGLFIVIGGSQFYEYYPYFTRYKFQFNLEPF